MAEQHAEMCRQRLERARVRLEALQAELAELTEKVAAFDRALARLDSRVRADALGVINGSPKRYGEYGALSAFMKHQLFEAGSKGSTTSELVLSVRVAFNLEFASPDEVDDFRRNIVRAQLRKWQRSGDIEMTHRPKNGCQVSCWRWKQGPMLPELSADEAG
jgi:hypothetical protein